MRILMVAAIIATMAVPALAAEMKPPVGSKSVSEIAAKVESLPGFSYFHKIEWEGGYYKVEYSDKAGKEQKVKVDPKTGEHMTAAEHMKQKSKY